MISNLKVKDFKAVPYLETSSLMGSHPNGLKFSTSKPNVIVGPNGSGKSALLSTLALQTLSYFTGESSFDNQFLNTSGDQEFWSKLGYSWSQEYAYLQGLTCKTDHAPALYYRPGTFLEMKPASRMLSCAGIRRRQGLMQSWSRSGHPGSKVSPCLSACKGS